jgi:hypothetical protein
MPPQRNAPKRFCAPSGYGTQKAKPLAQRPLQQLRPLILPNQPNEMNTPNAKDKNKNEVVAPVSKELWAVMEPGKHALQFQCDWAVYPVGTHASLCYATSEERARWISDRLNELRALKASSTLPTEAPPVTREERDEQLAHALAERLQILYGYQVGLNDLVRALLDVLQGKDLAKPKAVAQGQPPARDEMPPAACEVNQQSRISASAWCPQCQTLVHARCGCFTAEWEYNPYRAALTRNGKFFAMVTPDGRNALSAEDAVTLLHALNAQTDVTGKQLAQRAAQTPDGSNNDSAPAIPKEDPLERLCEQCHMGQRGCACEGGPSISIIDADDPAPLSAERQKEAQ